MFRAFLFAPVTWALNHLKEEVMAALDHLATEVTEARTVMESAATLITGLKASLDEAIEKLNQGDNGAALEALSTSLDTSSNALAAAITANTPAEPPAPAPEPAPAPAPAPAPTEPPVAG